MKKSAGISKENLDFLRKLKKNNNRDWFARNKQAYLGFLSETEHFADALFAAMKSHDAVEATRKNHLHRIYRDVRFSNDKTPYKSHWSGGFSRATKARRGSYYFHIEPGNSFVAGGFWAPEPTDLKRIRDEFAFDAAPFRKIIGSKVFKSTFGKLEGELVKTTPKGFDPADPAIDLIRYRQFELLHYFTDAQVVSASFVKAASETFKKMRPFLDYMSEVLTTDINGESIIG